MKVEICGSETLANKSVARGHPGLNQGPLDLQSNALPLSYIPLRKGLNSTQVYRSIMLAGNVRFRHLLMSVATSAIDYIVRATSYQ